MAHDASHRTLQRPGEGVPVRTPASLRRYLADRVAAVGALTALSAGEPFYFYAHDNPELMSGYSLGWAGNKARACS